MLKLKEYKDVLDEKHAQGSQEMVRPEQGHDWMISNNLCKETIKEDNEMKIYIYTLGKELRKPVHL